MSELQRLEIQGIRSFVANPTDIDSQSIVFEGPVTLITGENGTGKTTIIESLKYVTMGDISVEMINDPNIWEVDKINAKVSLGFKSMNGNQYNVTRRASSIKTPKRKTGLSIKTGECRIEIQSPDGNIQKIDVNSTESKSQVPMFLGVSPSILENVIFCHQQDSCWPVESDKKELKARFDQIFGSEKYDKATKALKEVLKNLKAKKVEHEKNAAVHNTRQETLLKFEKQADLSRKNIQSSDHEIQNLEVLYFDKESKLQEHDKVKSIVDEINKKIDNQEGQSSSELKFIESIHSKITDLIPPEAVPGALEVINGEITSAHEILEMHTKFYNEKQENYKKTVEKRDTLKKEVDRMSTMLDTAESHRKYFMSKMDDFKNNYSSDDFQGTLSQKMLEQSEAEEELLKLKDQQREKMEQKDIEIREIESSYSTQNGELTALNSNLKSAQNELKKIGSINEEKIQQTKEKLDQIILEKNELSQSGRNNETIASEIKQKEQEQQQKEQEQENLDEKFQELQKVKRSCEEFAKDYNDLKNAENKFAQAEAKKEQFLSEIRLSLEDDSIDADDAERLFKKSLNEATDTLKTIRNQLSDVNNRFSFVSNNLERAKSSFASHSKESNEAKERIDQVITPDDESFAKAYEITQQLLNEENDRLSRLSNSKDVYLNFKNEAARCENGCHSCPLCKRGFSNDDEYNAFVEEQLEKFIQSLPSQIQKCRISKRMLESRMDSLEKIRVDIDTFERNKYIIETNQKEIDNLTKEQDELISSKVSLEQELTIAEEKLAKIQNLKSTVDFLKQALKERESAKKEKTRASAHLNNDLPPLDQVQSEMSKLEQKKTEIYDRLKSLYQEQNQYSKRHSEITSKFTKLNSEYSILTEKLQKKQELDEIISNLHSQIGEKDISVKLLKNKLDDLRRIRKETAKLNDEEFTTKNDRVNKTKQERQRCQDLVNEINKAKAALDEVDSGEMSLKLIENKKLLDSQEEEVKSLAESIEKYRQIVAKDNAKIPSLHEQRNNLNLQNDYYERLKSYHKIQSELNELRTQRNNKLGSLANLDIEELKAEFKELSDKLVMLKTEKRKEEENYRKAINEAKEYESARKELSEATINLKSVELCISDVNRYIKALDETLLDYHAKKMQEVNDTIQQLWENVYYGTDIDSIFIKCEKSTASKSEYEYKVVMRKDNVELDMFGRCSAGQKMLASIIIRLALAETFSVNCGVMALDEPTTNLDVQNMKNLASQLVRLVESRQNSQGKSFQLIVITHSTEFVKLLLQSGSFDHFYQITRGSDGTHHYSQIKKCAETVLLT
ncbi:hypothetical protein TRFO_11716 [Tritrichomonas foetus]|uniref:Uncharacterized protein n=1 Tax=Tritrichomonas foetus TaxID=1144522 RepID=A0A1J4J2B0_9EUKA|nr:hypothetical protein TRFO_11716 [Tritrichomonas foetus]|eukprot:OHS93514.1 hypothetical protein TRFO_11716 [Tritrichomonas foetus]